MAGVGTVERVAVSCTGTNVCACELVLTLVTFDMLCMQNAFIRALKTPVLNRPAPLRHFNMILAPNTNMLAYLLTYPDLHD